MCVARRCAVSREGGSGRGGGVGGAPPPRSGIGVLPHFPPQRNPTCTFPPTDVHHRSPRATRKRQKAGVSRWEIVGRATANLCKTACRSPFCTRPCRSAARFRPPRVPPVGRSGIPVYRPAPDVDLSPTMRGDEDHAPARPDPGARAVRRHRRRLRLVQRQRRRRRSGRARSRRAPRSTSRASCSPDGKVRSDLEGALKKILRTDDPGAKIQQLSTGSGKSDGRHLQGRRRAVAGRPRRRRRHRAAQRPGRRLRRGHRLQGRRQGRGAARQAEGRHRQALLQGRRLPLRPQGEDRDGASSTTASSSPPRAG